MPDPNINPKHKPKISCILDMELHITEKCGKGGHFEVRCHSRSNKNETRQFVKIAIDSGASCNLISDGMLEFITGCKVNLLLCDKKILCFRSS